MLPITWCCSLTDHGSLVTAAVAFATLAVAASVDGGSVLLRVDEPVQRWVEAHRTDLLDDVFRAFSRLGSSLVVFVLVALGVIVTRRRCPALAVTIVSVTIGRLVIETVMKIVVGRDRPELEPLVAGVGKSFPSGHVLAAIATWGLLPAIVVLFTKRPSVWLASVYVSAVLILGIAASRVYLGVHWLSDVVGGLILGTLLLIPANWAFQRTHERWPGDPAQAPTPGST